LILSAGSGYFGKLEELSYAKIASSVDLNLLSNIYITKTFLPHLKKAKRANIIFIGSSAALQGKKEGSIYCACKFAMRGFFQALREECASSNVRVSIIQPDLVSTPFYDKLHFKPKEGRMHSLAPEDIANVVELILSLDSHVVLDEILLSPLKRALEFS
jgi:3-hydroxy acid dehydrogenase / malonic semialdehyde reductase